MIIVDYFKLQAKNLLKDFKTQKMVFDISLNDYMSEYSPKFFDIDQIFLDYDLPEDAFTLMNAQHIIAKMIGFNKWSDFIKATAPEQELAKLIFDNQHKISLDDWESYISRAGYENKTFFKPEQQVDEIFKMVFANSTDHHNPFPDYRLNFQEVSNTFISNETKELYDKKNLESELVSKKKILTAIKEHQKAGLGFPENQTVECLHCGEQFLFGEVKVTQLKMDKRKYIMCKNYPKCDGSLMDFFPIDDNHKEDINEK